MIKLEAMQLNGKNDCDTTLESKLVVTLPFLWHSQAVFSCMRLLLNVYICVCAYL